jgi:hypothetical protein
VVAYINFEAATHTHTHTIRAGAGGEWCREGIRLRPRGRGLNYQRGCAVPLCTAGHSVSITKTLSRDNLGEHLRRRAPQRGRSGEVAKGTGLGDGHDPEHGEDGEAVGRPAARAKRRGDATVTHCCISNANWATRRSHRDDEPWTISASL